MDAQLREAKADRKESERDRRTTEAVEQLKRFFPGDSLNGAADVTSQYPGLLRASTPPCMVPHRIDTAVPVPEHLNTWAGWILRELIS